MSRQIPAYQWTPFRSWLLKFAALYVLLNVVPLYPEFYRLLFSDHGSYNITGKLFEIFHFQPIWVSGLEDSVNWVITIVAAVVGATIWNELVRSKSNNDLVLYTVRGLARYRLAAGLLAYGFVKFYPLLSPYPSLSHLNTPYGDFDRWHIFSLTLGIVPGYQRFLGGVEIILALLLLNRRTASISAFLILIFTGNVVVSNIGYEGGDVVYSLILTSLALFIISVDIPRIYKLLISQEATLPQPKIPLPFQGWKGRVRAIALPAFLLIFAFYAFNVRKDHLLGFGKYPGTAGRLQGLYTVSAFRYADSLIPYSTHHPFRWQNLVFETWNTLSIRNNAAELAVRNNSEHFLYPDGRRDYEYQGAGGRNYYTYSFSNDSLLVLQQRNANGSIKDSFYIHAEGKDRYLVRGYWQGKPLEAHIERTDKKYLLQEAAKRGRGRGLSL